MANSTRNRAQRQPPAQADICSRDRGEIAKGKDGPTGESRSTLETPNLWHTGPRSECWTSTSVTESGSWGSPFAAPGRPALRLRRMPRRRTLLHSSRPFQGAEARRFTRRQS
jgi:hypothetical protein